MAFNRNFFSKPARNQFNQSGGGWSPPFNPSAGGQSDTTPQRRRPVRFDISRPPRRELDDPRPETPGGNIPNQGGGNGMPFGQGGSVSMPYQNPFTGITSSTSGTNPPAPYSWTTSNSPMMGTNPQAPASPSTNPQAPAPAPTPNPRWQNFVNFNTGNASQWRPEWMQGANQEDILAWYNALNNEEDPNFGAAFGDLMNYGMGSMLGFLDPRTAQRFAMSLDQNREGDYTQNNPFGVAVQDFGLNPNMGASYQYADNQYNSRERLQEANDFWNRQLQEIVGLAGGGTTVGNNNQENDILEGLQSFGNNVFRTAAAYAPQGGGTTNRYAQGRRDEELAALFNSVQGTPLEAFAGILQGVVNPERFYNRGTGARFGMVTPPPQRR